ncbi:capsular exopolysaccharide family [Coriobacterium glomerans PW2]|uniref:Capsular exopolysaccharide family n=1 Tax=Coriobacterium glomerans (strain ATCC 49209 / DSM 20642 / JCM 10262 / PW2) TaxID=700015 RepID=F2N8A0_CORGP|nr:polysaccharide biosynthesis tyrosine autokinase [Coriobacterium glomerans]AEB07283.1 capsular exopolysaccharide family [Coriobacterium glomerans PW2]
MTLRDLAGLIRKRLWIIILLTATITGMAGIYCSVFVRDQYKAATTLYILVSDDSSNKTNLSTAFGVSERIAEDVSQLVKSQRVQDQAAKALGMPSLDGYETSVVSDKNSLVLQIAVTGPSAESTSYVANALAAAVADVSHEFMGVYSVKVVDKAPVPMEPTGMSKTKFIAEAFVGALLASTALIALPALLDDRIRNIETAEQVSDLPVLGTIADVTDVHTPPRDVSEARALLTAAIEEDAENVAAASPVPGQECEALESARTVLANLAFLKIGDPIRSITVTSAADQEGSPDVALLVAKAAASDGRKVLLVECDFRNRPLFDLIGAHSREGLRSVLSQCCSLVQAVCDIGHENVFFLDAETGVPNPTELISSERFKALHDILSEHFSYIVYNAPRLGPFADAAILSALSDAALLVVRNGVTRAGELEKGSGQLRKAGPPVAGIAYNRTKVSQAEHDQIRRKKLSQIAHRGKQTDKATAS